jgi:hypothetical protein
VKKEVTAGDRFVMHARISQEPMLECMNLQPSGAVGNPSPLSRREATPASGSRSRPANLRSFVYGTETAIHLLFTMATRKEIHSHETEFLQIIRRIRPDSRRHDGYGLSASAPIRRPGNDSGCSRRSAGARRGRGSRAQHLHGVNQQVTEH